MKNNDSDTNINDVLQNAWDWLSVTSDAIGRSRFGFERLFEKIAKRCIDEAEKENPSPENDWILRDIHFNPTQEEREELRNLYNEWQIYKTLHKEKVEAYEFVQRYKKPYEGQKSRVYLDLAESIIKVIFYLSVFIASLIIIIKTF
jgi:hypothetical protein